MQINKYNTYVVYKKNRTLQRARMFVREYKIKDKNTIKIKIQTDANI